LMATVTMPFSSKGLWLRYYLAVSS